MANKKTSKTKKATKTTAVKEYKKGEGGSAPAVSDAVAKDILPSETMLHRILPYVFVLLAAFFALCFIAPHVCGILGGFVKNALFGIFGTGSVIIPMLLLILAFYWRREVDSGRIYTKSIFSAVILIFFSAFLHICTGGPVDAYSVSRFYDSGVAFSGGGVIGGGCALLLSKCVGNIFTVILSVLACVILSLLLFGLTPASVLLYIKYKRKLRQEAVARARERAEQEAEEELGPEKEADEPIDLPVPAAAARKRKPEKTEKLRKKPKNDPLSMDLDFEKKEDPSPIDTSDLIDLEDDEGNKMKVKPVAPTRAPSDKLIYDYEDEKAVPDLLAEDEAEPSTADTLELIFGDDPDPMGLTDQKPEAKTPELPFDLDDELFTSEPEIEVERTEVGTPLSEMAAEKQPEVKPYQFPPITLLAIDNNTKFAAENKAEIEANAEKLIERLESFKVKASLSGYTSGPTITRYELKPAPGVRVRSIVNLVDDIAMSFATMGVRIEAPIPGKEAVGIEVPNKHVRTVHIRELIDSDTFKNAQSKLLCALGMDVGGEPVFLDIQKMPHLLIAGATGMGKSVCINSLIMSILMHATPEEVRLIMIDPKKVEFVPYSGIPHLLVPVVSDPKKAAGSLHWAVEEMERRFDLIESVGVRDLAGYNKATKDDPDMEHLSQVVIIIDELADLMMTAPDDVETSICRLAQKARAAGMHLIIGTQRPSVDVITGLIKANIPSRISCKTSSQIDSRTILDIAGAEKLMGKGDMLYAPVGIAKPIRLQGAFVSDAEVEAVTTFLKNNVGKAEYDTDVINKIEKEASLCGTNKKSAAVAAAGDDDGEADDLLRPAIDIAFETGRISTSLFQRKLSIGYGRAAKLIDKMEEMGIASPADGKKPRTLLMTKTQYMEMVVHDEDGI